MSQMNIKSPRIYLGSLLLLSILGFLIFLSNSSYIEVPNTKLANAIVLDFVLTIPILYYLIIRKTKIPKITVITCAVVCIILASYVIPIAHQSLLDSIKSFGLPILELLLLGLVSFYGFKTYRSYQNNEAINTDFYGILKEACAQVMPSPFSKLFATEIGVIYYSLVAWDSRALKNNEYSYHKRNGITSVVIVLLFVVAIEILAVHLVASKWSHTVAYVLSFFGIYSCLQVFAVIKSVSRRPYYINEDKETLELKYGMFAESIIGFDQIESIEYNRKSLPEDKSIVQFSTLGILDSHNVILHLKEKNVIDRIYGMKKEYNSLAIMVDEHEDFLQRMEKLIGHKELPE